MKTFYVEVDTNDADYIGQLVKVEDEVAEKWMSLIEKIKNFKPYRVVSKYNMVWEKPIEVELTMQQIADKFGIDVNQLKIKK